MRFYQLVYRTRRSEHSVHHIWPYAREHFGLAASSQYDSGKIAEYVSAYNDTKYPPSTEWFASEREAVVRRLELFGKGHLSGKKLDHKIWPIDIPTDKQSLLGWLKENCV